MKPYVICHMVSSVDGRILGGRWRPSGNRTAGLFERLHDLLGDAWLVGRVTGQEFAKAEPYPDQTNQTYPRQPWFARRDADACWSRAAAPRTAPSFRPASSTRLALRSVRPWMAQKGRRAFLTQATKMP